MGNKICPTHGYAYLDLECPWCEADEEERKEPADIWKGHAEVFTKAAAAQGVHARICETNGAHQEALVCRVLSCVLEDLAERYEAKASNPAKDGLNAK